MALKEGLRVELRLEKVERFYGCALQSLRRLEKDQAKPGNKVKND